MNFEDEVYVRLYTRDTKTWLRLGFEGQTVLALTLRKLDRAGVIDEVDDAAADVALLIGAPVEFVRVGLGRLLERDVFRLNGNQLVMPNYVHAQTCRQSDRVRQQESRARRRAGAMWSDQSRAVTESHQPSPAVTDCHSVLSSALLSLAEPRSDHCRVDSTAADVHRVFDGWKLELGHPKAKLDKKRSAIIRARLSDGFGVAELLTAIRGVTKSDWHMGRDPRSNGTVYDEIKTIFRDRAQVEKFIALAEGKTNATHRAIAATSGAAPRQPNHGKSGWERLTIVGGEDVPG